MYKKSNSTLIVFTDRFPHGKGETFLENEIPYMSQNFKKIIFIPQSSLLGYEGDLNESFLNKDRIARLPINCEVLSNYTEYSEFFGGRDILKRIPLNELFFHFIRFTPIIFDASIKDFRLFIKEPKVFMFKLFNYYMKSISLEIFLNSLNGKVIYYSYWMYSWVTVLAILKKRNRINSFVARGHGNDIYIENYGSYKIMYRQFELSQIKLLFTVSEQMKNYVSEHYPKFQNKIVTQYLGVESRGKNPTEKKAFRIVTASNIIYLKRLERMVEILQTMDIELEWVHFGNGPLFDNLKRSVHILQKNKPNIKITLFGRVDNNFILDYYLNNHVTVFLNLSLTEGVPVSIMEALSTGIPIIATNVGGTIEVIPDKKYLLKKDFQNKDVSNLLYKVWYMDNEKYYELREKSYLLFKNKFNAKVNYTNYFKGLL